MPYKVNYDNINEFNATLNGQAAEKEMQSVDVTEPPKIGRQPDRHRGDICASEPEPVSKPPKKTITPEPKPWRKSRDTDDMEENNPEPAAHVPGEGRGTAVSQSAPETESKALKRSSEYTGIVREKQPLNEEAIPSRLRRFFDSLFFGLPFSVSRSGSVVTLEKDKDGYTVRIYGDCSYISRDETITVHGRKDRRGVIIAQSYSIQTSNVDITVGISAGWLRLIVLLALCMLVYFAASIAGSVNLSDGLDWVVVMLVAALCLFTRMRNTNGFRDRRYRHE